MPVAGMMQRKQKAAIMGLKMELVGKRYWLWNLSEWCFDRIIALAQMVTFTAYGVLARLFESPYDESRLRAIRRRISEMKATTELRATKEAAEPKNALDMMDVVWEVGAADEKVKEPGSEAEKSEDEEASASAASAASKPSESTAATQPSMSSAMEYKEMSSRDALIFSLFSVPAILQGIGLVYDEPYYGAVANASIWFVFCIIFVDWAAGSPAGVATQVKKIMPVGLRSALAPLNPKGIFFTLEADKGRRAGFYSGQLARPSLTENNGLW